MYQIIATLGDYSSIIDTDDGYMRALDLWLQYRDGYGYDWTITLEYTVK